MHAADTSFPAQVSQGSGQTIVFQGYRVLTGQSLVWEYQCCYPIEIANGGMSYARSRLQSIVLLS